MDRNLAKKLAKQTLEIVKTAIYIDNNGQEHFIEEETSNSVINSLSITPDQEIEYNIKYGTTEVEIINCPTFLAAKKLKDLGKDPLVLNFASAKHPGGGWLQGALAQEEYLCRNSALIASLLHNSDYYDYHNNLIGSLYSSWMILSPQVPVIRDEYNQLIEPWYCDILTCAAVNASALKDKKAAEKAMKERIFRIIQLACSKDYKSLVLGAWGCGVFGNDIDFVANTFKETLFEFRGCFENVIFAILDSSEEEKFIGPFKKVFENVK